MGRIKFWSRRVLSSLLALSLLAGLVPAMAAPAGPAAQPAAASGTSYYVDAVRGSDSNPGTSAGAPWRSLQKVNSTTFAPGDAIYFSRGSVWEGQLWPKGSGTAEAPIIIQPYGDSAAPRPLINGNGGPFDSDTDRMVATVLLRDQEYWEISGLEITNRDSGSLSGGEKPLIGVALDATDEFGGGTVDHIYLRDLYIHDVTGKLSNKQTGGIEGLVTATRNRTNFNDVLIEDCLIQNVSNTGIRLTPNASFKQNFENASNGVYGLPNVPDNASAGDWFGSTNVVLRNNFIDVALGDGIVAAFCDAPIVEYNTVKDCHYADNGAYYAGIWGYLSRDAVFQFNEAYLTHTVQDGQGLDADAGYRNVFQYNYSHDNEGGFMLMIGDSRASGLHSIEPVVRYNISQNDQYTLFTHQRAVGAQVYNNTIYVSGKTIPVQLNTENGSGSYYNNIFYAGPGADFSNWTRGSKLDITYDHNLYYREDGPVSAPDDANGLVDVDPMLEAPGSGGTGMDTVGGYQLRLGSPAVNAGRAYLANPLLARSDGGAPNPGILDNPLIDWDRDYFGNPLGNGGVDLGAHEFSAVRYEDAPEAASGKVALHTALCDARYYQDVAASSGQWTAQDKAALDAAVLAAQSAYEGADGFDAAAVTLRGALDRFLSARAAEDSAVTLPAGTRFDPAAPANITLDVAWNGNGLAGVSNSGAALAPGDYSLTADGKLAISAGYLSGFTADQTLTIRFTAGEDQQITIPYAPLAEKPSISPEAAVHDHYAPADITVAVNGEGETLTAVQNGGDSLLEGVDYSSSGSGVTIFGAYLQGFQSTQTLVFRFSGGTERTLTVSYRDSNPNHAVSGYTQDFETADVMDGLKVYGGVSTVSPLPELVNSDTASVTRDTAAALNGAASLKLVQPGNSSQYDIIVADPSAPKAGSGIYEATFQVTDFSTDIQQIRFLFRFQDTQNYASLAFASPQKWTVYSKTDGAASYGPIVTNGPSIVKGGAYKVRIQYEGDVYSLSLFSGPELTDETVIFKNRTIASAPNGGQPFQGAGGIGIMLSSMYGKTVLLDDLSYMPLAPAQPDVEIPQTSFVTEGGASLVIPADFHGDTVSAVSTGDTVLAGGDDYTVQAGSLTLTSSGLAKLANGQNIVKVSFARSNPVFLSITKGAAVVSSVDESGFEIEPRRGDRGDVELSVSFGAGDSIQKLTDGSRTLRPGLDYVARPSGLTVTSSYLASLDGPVTLTVSFARGSSDTVDISIRQVQDSVLTTGRVLYDKSASGGAADFQVELNGNRLTGLLVDGVKLAPSHYTMNGGTLSLSGAYLDTLDGSYTLTLQFNNGAPLTATLVVSEYIRKVSFDSNGADTPANPAEAYVLAPAETLSAFPTPPVKAGNRFDGWFTQPSGGTPFTAATPVTGGLTVYAHWTSYSDVLSTVKSVEAVDGRITVVFDAENAPLEVLLNDFAVTYQLDGGVSRPLSLTGCGYSASGRTAILHFAKLAGVDGAHTVSLSLSYAGKTPLSASYTAAQQQLPSDAFAIYNFEPENGGPWADKSGNNRDLVQNGTLPLAVDANTSTGSGQSFQLSGHDRKPEDTAKGPSFDLVNTQNFTISLWVSIEADSYRTEADKSKMDGIFLSHNGSGPQIINNSNNGNGFSVGHITNTGLSPLEAGAWRQCVLTAERGASPQYKLYLDGQLRWSSDRIDFSATGDAFVYGRASGGGGFHGNLDNIYLYNSKALTEAEVDALYVLGGGLNRAGLREAIAEVEAMEIAALGPAIERAKAVLENAAAQAELDQAERVLRLLLVSGETFLGITTQPASYTSVKAGAITEALSAQASVYPENTPISYKWYRSSNGEAFDGAEILGEASAFSIPADLAPGTYYFYCTAEAAGAQRVYSHMAEVYVRPAAGEGIRFGVVSDFQIGGEFNGSVHNLQKIRDALERILDEAGGIENLDAVLFVGDMEDHGYEDEFQAVSEAVRSVIPADSGVECLYLLGNHEYFGGAPAKDLFRQYHGMEPNTATVVNGYTFLTVSQDSSSGYNAETRTWLEAELARAAARDPEKPIFVAFHLPIANTIYGSMPSWSQTDFKSILEAYPQAVAFSGHSHVPLNDERSIWQDGYTAVNTGFTAYMEMETNLTESSKPDGYREESQGLFVTVDSGLTVTLKRLDFMRPGAYLGDDWVLSAPHDGSAFQYTNALRPGAAPVFPEGASVTVTPSQVSGRLATITFPQAAAAAGDNVYRYKAEFYTGGALAFSETFFSDYYKGDGREDTLSWTTTKLTPGATYTVKLYAYDSLGEAKGMTVPNESEPIESAAFTTAASGSTPPDFRLNLDGNRRNTALEQNVVVQGNLDYVPGKDGQAAYFHDNSFLLLDYGAHLQSGNLLISYDKSFSTAFWLNVQESAGDTPVIFSNKDVSSGGGNGFAFYIQDGTLMLNAKPNAGSQVNGAEDIAVADVSEGEWLHVAVNFDQDAGKITVYVNGAEAGSYDADLSGGLGGGKQTFLAQSISGSSKHNNASRYVHFYLDQFQMTSEILTDDEIRELASADEPVAPESAQVPEISAQPEDLEAVVGEEAALSVTAAVKDGGALSYQWYERVEKAPVWNLSDGSYTTPDAIDTPILNATDDTYVPPTGTLGTFCYYVVVTNTNMEATVTQTAETTSRVACVTVVESEDNTDVAFVKDLLESTAFTAPAAEVSTEEEALARVEAILLTLLRRGVSGAVTPIEFTPAVNGSEDAPAGRDGSFTFTVTLSKNAAAEVVTKELTLQIAAEDYRGPVHVKEISVDGPDSLKVGDKAVYTARVTPAHASNQAVVWSVDDTAVASIDAISGAFTALAVGKAAITATAADGSGVIGSRTVTITGRTPSTPDSDPAPDAGTGTKPDPTPEPPVVNLTSSNGGKVEAKANKDGSITYLFQSEAGHVVQYVRVNGLLVKAEDSYTVPAGEEASLVVIFADPNADPLAQFTDVDGLSAEFADAVSYAVGAGLFTGTGPDTFAPDESMSRAMFATVLARLYGADTRNYKAGGFTDMEEGAWYGPSVAWAAEMGYVQGVGGGLFAPERPLTRQELVTLIYRFAQKSGVDTGTQGDLSGYGDSDELAGWAADSMRWAVGLGLINGRGAGTLAPTATLTRVEAAVILQRMAELLVKA